MSTDDNPKPHPESQHTERISVSLSSGQKSELQRVAVEKKVSLAWVIREAIDVYLGKQSSS
jgi:predicted transcriptional regulator